MKRSIVACCVVVLVLLGGRQALAGPAEFVVVNNNAPGVGFNDPTPAAPIGGNTGATLGEQRLIALNHALQIWSARLDSDVPVVIRAQFVPLGAGILGSAGPLSVYRDFAGAPLPGTWYAVALANKLVGEDLADGLPQLQMNFSTNFNFYLGIDNQSDGRPDLVAVLLHELAHGLGFLQFSSLQTGALLGGFPDVYNTQLLDTTLGLTWPEMTNAQRVAAATRFGRVVWTGESVSNGVPGVLAFGSPGVRVTSPAPIAGAYQFGTAAFGPTIGNPDVAAAIVAVEDAVEPGGTSTDGCSPFTNAAAVAGNIALIERGLCGFAVKARNATDAGAAAVIIYNNAANVNAGPPGMGDDGINGQFVTIPTVSLRRADGLAIIGVLAGGVNAELGVDLTIRAGADGEDRARVFAPFPVAGGSSISHYDSVARPNLLMEPAINADLTHSVKAPNDLTFELLQDLGWTFPDADGDGVPDDEDCNPSSDLRPTIIIGTVDTGVPNVLYPDGCTRADLIAALAASTRNHGQFVSALAELTNDWVQNGEISAAQRAAIQFAAARTR